MNGYLKGLVITCCSSPYSLPVLPLYAWTIPSVLTTGQHSNNLHYYSHILSAFYSCSSHTQSGVTSGTGLRMFLRGVQQLDIMARIAQYTGLLFVSSY